MSCAMAPYPQPQCWRKGYQFLQVNLRLLPAAALFLVSVLVLLQTAAADHHAEHRHSDIIPVPPPPSPKKAEPAQDGEYVPLIPPPVKSAPSSDTAKTPSKAATLPASSEQKSTTPASESKPPAKNPSKEVTVAPKKATKPISSKPNPATVLLEGLAVDIVQPGIADDKPLQSIPAFKNGLLLPYFKPCPPQVKPQYASFNGTSGCFLDSVYNDRLNLLLTYGDASLKKMGPITVQAVKLVTTGHAAVPNITNAKPQKFTSDDRYFSVGVNYNCKPGKAGVVDLSLSLIVRNATAKAHLGLWWQKSCAGGEPIHVTLTYASDGKKTSLFPLKEAKVRVSPSSTTSTLTAAIDPSFDFVQQGLAQPVITTSDTSIVTAKVRGPLAAGGVLQSAGEPKELVVAYECLRKGAAYVSLTIPIPPLTAISVSWAKDCGGRVAPALMVGTKRGEPDVVKGGLVQPLYAMKSAHIGKAHSKEHVHLGSTQSYWKLYVWTGDHAASASRGLHVGRPVLTLGDPSVVYASTSQLLRLSHGGSKRKYQYGDQSALIGHGDVVELSFYLVCKKKGESRVLVTLPLTHFEAIDFGFAKVCEGAQVARRHRGSGLTAGSAAVLVVLAMIAAAAVVVYLRRRRRAMQVRYKPVSTVAGDEVTSFS